MHRTSQYRRHPGLPQELKDEIIGYLSTDTDALEVCSLSHSSFLAACQKGLFAKVALKGGLSKSNAQNFKSLLQDSPHLAKYIQRIELVERNWEGQDRWLPQDVSLLATLPLLSNLSAFYLQCHRESWYNISTDLVDCLSSVLRLPSLEHVQLEGVPLEFLSNAGPSVKHISLRNISLPEPRPISPFLRNPLEEPLSIESLQILDLDERDMELIDNWLQPTDNHLSFKRLKRLYISGGDELGPCLAKFLDVCRSSLEILVYTPCIATYYESQGAVPDYLDISTLASLRVLRVRLEVNIDPLEDAFYNPLPWLTNHLDSLPPSNIIEELTIHLTLIENIDAGAPWQWQALSAAILKNLKRLHSIEIHIYCFTSEEYDVYTEDIFQNTKDLQSAGFFRLLRDDDLRNDPGSPPPSPTWKF